MPGDALLRVMNNLNWIPLAGDFAIQPDQIRFNGGEFPATPQPAQDQPPPGPKAGTASPETSPPAPSTVPMIGLLASNRYLTDGVVRARVRFAQIGMNRTTFEFCLFRDRDRRHFVSVGLGASGFAFAIREFAPASDPAPTGALNTWSSYRSEGLFTYFQADRDYAVEVRLQAGTVTLVVDDVPVVGGLVPTLQGGPCQLGAFFCGDKAIEVRDVEISASKPTAFVVMQFDGAFDELYKHVIKEVCEEFEVSTLRADETVGPGVIMEDIVRDIEAARLVVADITPANPNVYFEVGYARALKKPVILLAQKGTKLPFDVSGFRVLFYENTIGGKARLDDNMRKHLAEVLK